MNQCVPNSPLSKPVLRLDFAGILSIPGLFRSSQRIASNPPLSECFVSLTLPVVATLGCPLGTLRS